MNILRPNLSSDFIFGALASALLVSSGALAGCGNAEPPPKAPVQATEVNPAASPGTAGHASCSAGSCGAKKEEKATTDSVKSADKPAEPSSVTPAVAPAAALAVTPAPAPSAATTPAKSAPKPAAVPPKKAATGGQAACGAGTCAAKK